MLDKWQVAAKYREMIESMHVEEINGMNKHYTIILKEGYINDATGSRNIYADRKQDIRWIITKSHKQLRKTVTQSRRVRFFSFRMGKGHLYCTDTLNTILCNGYTIMPDSKE